ncbi:MAG: hypothetical protein ABI193_16240, partial [Minicystis sp.]
MRRTLSPRAALGLATGAALLLLAAESLARPGGGQSFGGGSKSGGGSSGGGGGGGAGLIIDLLFLLVRYPAIGVPVLIIVIVFFAVTKAKEGWKQSGWSSNQGESLSSSTRAHAQAYGPAGQAPQASTRSPYGARQPSPRQRLEQLRGTDPDFSLVLFEDFLYALYAEAHQARGGHQLDRLTPYLSEAVRAR